MDRVRADEAVLTRPRSAPLHRFRFAAMGSAHEIVVASESAARAKRAAAAAIADVQRIERKYSRYRQDSVTAAINRAAGGARIAIDAETVGLLRYADRCHAMSDGRFDVTSGVLRRAWNFRAERPRVPSPVEVDAARRLVGWKRVQWSERDLRLPIAGMELDFGGIGKEYAADRVATICLEHGVAHALVNLGGDVRALGGRDAATPWRVGIRHPRIAGAIVRTVALVDGAVATSGDYERFFETGGRRYCHLLDARTGWPVAYWQSVSVVAPFAILAGSYATIAMLLGADALAFLALHDVPYVAIAANGDEHASQVP
jgi:thiamine biosynthesis lipoprotein